MTFKSQKDNANIMLKYYIEELATLYEAEAMIGEVPKDFRVDASYRTITITAPNEDAARSKALEVSHQLGIFPVKKEPYIQYNNTPATRYHVQANALGSLKFTFVGEGLPETCHVEYDDVEVPAQEARITKKARIVCDVPDTEEEALVAGL